MPTPPDTTPARLTPEQLAKIEKADSAYADTTESIPAVRHRRALLADRAAREQEYTDFRQQVAVELSAIRIVRLEGEAIAQPFAEYIKQRVNTAIHELAARLNLDLDQHPSSKQ